MSDAPQQVPSVDAQLVVPSESSGGSAYEYRLLEADATARENLNREADQRYWLRWAAVGLVFVIIIGMASLLTHVAHWLPNGPMAVNAVIALHIAPIISMTTLAIALLVAAFRGFKDGDEKAGAAIATESARATGYVN